MNDATPAPARTVRCPGCGGPSAYSTGNPWRPFCSQRCREGDLGAWASEAYRVPESTPPDPGSPADGPAH
jgi:endogenous inhibitor of DNA gyrase (YacG/DUF329 family)